MKKLNGLALACLAGCLCTQAIADVNINGFATIAGGMTTSDEDRLDGYDSDLNFTQNSLIGLQFDSDLGEGLTATAQIISRGNDDWNANVEWAYLGYEVNDNVKLLAGRQRVPFYYYSDYLDVSYAYHWLTPPESVYSLPFDSTNGIGAIFNNELGIFDSTLHLVYGANQSTVNISGEEVEVDATNLMTAAWNLNWDWLTLRLGYAKSDLKLQAANLDALADGWAAAGFPEFGPAISTTDDNNTGTFIDAGFTVDYENILINAEYTELTLEGIPVQGTKTSWYTTLGYRFGNVMPHITYGSSEEVPPSTSFLDSVPAGVDAGLDYLLAQTTGVFALGEDKHDYFILGLRWDFHSAAALKVDYKQQTDNQSDQSDNLLRFGVVTVF